MVFRRAAALLMLALSLQGCSWFEEVLVGWSTYEHPSLNFTIDYPTDWQLKTDADFGVQVQFFAPERQDLFRSNANIVVTKADVLDLDALADLSVRQLTALISGYSVDTKAYGNLGNLPGIDLRGRYPSATGPRMIRTVIAVDQGMQFVFTFTCPYALEAAFQKQVNKMIDSFERSNKIGSS
jgi:hypothetical protein